MKFVSGNRLIPLIRTPMLESAACTAAEAWTGCTKLLQLESKTPSKTMDKKQGTLTPASKSPSNLELVPRASSLSPERHLTQSHRSRSTKSYLDIPSTRREYNRTIGLTLEPQGSATAWMITADSLHLFDTLLDSVKSEADR